MIHSFLLDRVVRIIILSLFLFTFVSADDFSSARKDMVNEILLDVKRTELSTGKDSLNSRVVDALYGVPRHNFVRPGDEKYAYENRPLRIGYGQTISQPYIVAIMTELLDINAGDKILEIGTGSGYQAAILSVLAKSVFTIEIIEPLAKQARIRLSRMGFDNVQVRLADGYYGWQEEAPFDAIVVTAAATHIPAPLLNQLKPGGKMVAPVGSQFFTQQLMLIERSLDGTVRTRQILPVSFVPLTGVH